MKIQVKFNKIPVTNSSILELTDKGIIGWNFEHDNYIYVEGIIESFKKEDLNKIQAVLKLEDSDKIFMIPDNKVYWYKYQVDKIIGDKEIQFNSCDKIEFDKWHEIEIKFSSTSHEYNGVKSYTLEYKGETLNIMDIDISEPFESYLMSDYKVAMENLIEEYNKQK